MCFPKQGFCKKSGIVLYLYKSLAYGNQRGFLGRLCTLLLAEVLVVKCRILSGKNNLPGIVTWKEEIFKEQINVAVLTLSYLKLEELGDGVFAFSGPRD